MDIVGFDRVTVIDAGTASTGEIWLRMMCAELAPPGQSPAWSSRLACLMWTSEAATACTAAEGEPAADAVVIDPSSDAAGNLVSWSGTFRTK